MKTVDCNALVPPLDLKAISSPSGEAEVGSSLMEREKEIMSFSGSLVISQWMP
jgi:hypothetical protein